jgi:sulfonate transport system substrate-binding protein
MTKRASSVSSSSRDRPVELWYSRCGAATASAIAIRRGWLEAEFSRGGTTLRSLRDADDTDVRDAHYHHRISGLFREGGNIPPIWARASGAETAVVGITWLDEYQGILSLADGPVRHVADLVGRRLALPLNRNLIDFQRGAALHGFVTALRLAGAKPAEVELVDVLPTSVSDVSEARRARAPSTGPSAEVAALLEGRVDAIFLRFARGARLAHDPRFRQVININDLSDPVSRVNNGTPRPVTVDRRFLDRHPDLVARYLAVLLRTAAWAEHNPVEVLELLASEGSATVEDVLDSHGPEVHHSFYPRLTAEYVRGLDAQKNFLRDFGFITGDFDTEAWVAPGPLAEAQQLVRDEPALHESLGKRRPRRGRVSTGDVRRRSPHLV